MILNLSDISRLLVWSLFSLLFLKSKGENFSSIPADATDLLKHDKHAILFFPDGPGEVEDLFLITRQKTFHRMVQVSEQPSTWIEQLNRHFSGAQKLPLDTLFQFCATGYQQLIRPFEKELEDVYQISFLSEHHLLRQLPLGALVRNFGPDNRPRFLTEYWGVSYLYDWDFQRVQDRGKTNGYEWDSTGNFLSGELPTSGTMLAHRWPGLSHALPPGKAPLFQRLLEEGNYTDEALGITRTIYLDSVHASAKQNGMSGLDPLVWASTVVYGDISPIDPKTSFPWWVLVPLGLLLVIVFGKRL